MRHFFIILLVLLPVLVAAQGRKDYRAAMATFVTSYNNNDAAGIGSQFSERSPDRGRYTRGKLMALKDRFRNIRSYSYSRQREDGLIIFNVRFSKPKYNDPNWVHTAWVGVRLDKDNKIVRLKFPTNAYLNGEERYFMMKQY